MDEFELKKKDQNNDKRNKMNFAKNKIKNPQKKHLTSNHYNYHRANFVLYFSLSFYSFERNIYAVEQLKEKIKSSTIKL